MDYCMYFEVATRASMGLLNLADKDAESSKRRYGKEHVTSEKSRSRGGGNER
jgi:hypothetical protein